VQSENSNHPAEPNELQEAFLRLWTHHEPGLRAFVGSCSPNSAEVDEVMQDVSIAAWKKFHTLDDHSAFAPWVFTVAKYELLMTRRRHARNRLVLSNDIVETLAKEAAEEVTLRHQQLDALDNCIEKLPTERQELALAAYRKETSIRDIAKQQGRSEGSLYQLLSRIRKQLFQCMEQTLSQSS